MPHEAATRAVPSLEESDLSTPPAVRSGNGYSAIADQGAAAKAARTFRLGNRPPLTGIRAFGVTSVLVYHSNFQTFPGAWQSLGMFFTLSGFLITAMLLGEGERKKRISLKNFYSRRAVRLLPPLVLTSALLALYSAFHPVARAAERVWGDIAAALFYFADYRSALGHEPFWGYLAQTWSLSVEEQFYVIWAVLLVVAVKTKRLRLATAMAVCGVMFSAADRFWIIESARHYDHAVWARVYYAFDTRADALFIGCLLGIVAVGGHLENWSGLARRVLSIVAAGCAALVIWIGFEVPPGSRAMIEWWMPVAEIAWCVIIAYFVVNPRGIGSRFVGLGLFVFVGDLSYTLYLVHWPVYVALLPGRSDFWSIQLIRVAVIVAIAIPSWFLMERPLMRWRRRTLT